MGELPPYFVARAASAAGGMDEELEEIFDDEGGSVQTKKDESWIDRGKKKLAVFLKSYAFVTVLLMASVSAFFTLLSSIFISIDSQPSL